MSVKILAVAATETEASVLKREELRELFVEGDSDLAVLVTGVGSIATSWEMHKWFGSGNSCDLAFNLGIAGSFNESIGIGEVVMPVSDCFADAGIEDGERFYTLF
jgi:futalosine hydrolase